MTLVKKYVFSQEFDVLDVSIYDQEDIRDICRYYSKCTNIQIGLNELCYLGLFECITTLILTGGIPTEEGIECLYKCEMIENLVLDYEETDSDDEGVELTRFPSLKNVLSRSDLNIKNYASATELNCNVRVLNYYDARNGRKVKYNPDINICVKPKFLFFSTEAYTPAGSIIMQILKKVGLAFSERFDKELFSFHLTRIGIIPVCIPQHCMSNVNVKERKYVSIKRGYADIRLYIPYDEMVFGNYEQQKKLLLENIEKALDIVERKDKSLRRRNLEEAIKSIFQEI